MEYKVSYRRVKYPRLEFKTGELLLILPFGQDPKSFVEKHRRWITKKAEFIRDCLRNSSKKRLVKRNHGEFRDLIYSSVEEISKELGVKIGKVFFRRMKTKWASCSSRGNLTVNPLLSFLPDYLIEYVIFHEMTHLIEKRHNENFWRIISGRFEDHNELEKNLLEYWFLIQRFKSESIWWVEASRFSK